MNLNHSRHSLALLSMAALLSTPAFGQAPLTINAPFRRASPVADGHIGVSEYGAGFYVDFTGDSNPGRFWGGSIKTSATPADLSFTMYAAHTNTNLFLAYKVNDQFIDDQAANASSPFLNDAVEIFLDSDRKSNDFLPGSREGFQLVSDVSGNKLTVASDFTNADWKVVTSRISGGYIVEFAIPLSLLDTVDGAGYAAAKTGDSLRFNAAIDDNDRLVSAQDAQGVLWRAENGASPFGTREPGWNVDLNLSPAPVPEPGTVALFLAGGLTGAGMLLHRRHRK